MIEHIMQLLQTEVKEYLLEDPLVERAGLISKDFKFFPFDNTSTSPINEVIMSEEGFKKASSLFMDDNLLAWVHSHPS